MCQRVWLEEKVASNQGELAALIGRANIVMAENRIFEPDVCLCVVDHVATARNLQSDAVMTPEGYTEYVWHPKRWWKKHDKMQSAGT